MVVVIFEATGDGQQLDNLPQASKNDQLVAQSLTNENPRSLTEVL